MTQPAGDLSPDEVAQLRQQLAAYPRLPLIPDEQQGSNEDGPNGTNALPRLLDELERRRGEDQALNLFREDGGLVDKLASLVATARMNPNPGCGTCDHSLRYGACSAHVAKALINEVREQRLVILTAEAADQVVLTVRGQADQDANWLRDAVREVARQMDERSGEADAPAGGIAMGEFAGRLRELAAAERAEVNG